MIDTNYVTIKPVMKVNIPATLQQIPVGKKTSFTCKDFAPLASVMAAISRLKNKGELYYLSSIDNGVAFDIERIY